MASARLEPSENEVIMSTAFAASRLMRNRQVAAVIAVLVAYNGFVCWLNTLQHTNPFLPFATHLGNYSLLGLWVGIMASGFAGRWGTMVVCAAIIATHANVYLQRPELVHSFAGWAFWLTNLGELVVLMGALGFRLRKRQPVAPVVPLRPAPSVVATKQVRRAA